MGRTDGQEERADGVQRTRRKACDGMRPRNVFFQVSCGMQGSSAHGQRGIRVWCHHAQVQGEQWVHWEQWVQGEQQELGASSGCWQPKLAAEGGYPEHSSEMP